MITNLEEKRSLHEERDHIEMAIVDEILANKKGHLESEHRQKYLLDKYRKCSKQLKDLYAQQESHKLGSSMDEHLKHFYQKLSSITSTVHPDSLEFVNLEDDAHETPPLPPFTDEEAFGRYLDLYKCHTSFLQVLKKEDTKPNYLTFLDKFDHFSDLRRELKLTSAYRDYLEEMLSYFRDFSKRARPLLEFEELEREAHEKFVQQWNVRSIPGWFAQSEKSTVDAEPMVDLESYKSCDQLIELGLDCLKQELQARGLKCGGTLEERAKRLWSVRGKSADQIDDTLKARPADSLKIRNKKSIDPFYIASIEAKLTMYADHFNDHRLATIENVQRKQARTAEERNESDEDISDINDEEDDQTDVVYNPKNLPLDYNGKPIPYWLYKLHNLDKTFTCEICGNATYKGPKAFERHFAEWRHANGMRSLKIPNTAHFANITKIKDAISLWEKLKDEKQKDKFQPLVEEEFEDSQGNVVNRKTYEDLKRQGLL